jgi:hypothetical protein
MKRRFDEKALHPVKMKILCPTFPNSTNLNKTTRKFYKNSISAAT